MARAKYPESANTWDMDIQTALIETSVANEIIERIADGESLKDVCKSVGVSRATFYRWANANQEFSAQYQWARVCAGLTQGDNMVHLASEAMKQLRHSEDGPLNMDAAAIILKASPWLAERLAPGVYNQKQASGGQGGTQPKIEFSQADQNLC